MRMRQGWTIAGALGALALAFVPSASASTEVGSNCRADRTDFNATLVQLYNGPDAELPLATPVSGVVTSWKVNLGPVGVLPAQLKILEPGAWPNDFHVVAESPVVYLSEGQNVIDSRLKVEPGYRFGLYSQDGHTPYCHTAFAQDVLGSSVGNALVTSTHTFGMESQAQVPVAVKIEPDTNGDGFGDETQTRCPSSCLPLHTQSTGPDVGFSYKAGRGSVTVFVTPTMPANIAVKGTVRLGAVGRKLTLSTPSRNVPRAETARFKLEFPAKLKANLQEIAPRSAHQLKITIAATDAEGSGTISWLTA
ncbi:MAG TPA: hypothetical protein VJW23_00815, partial [Propionibacteriaceae bacterium]|nr:hypothetical protein [Propionibacteriaceae bacterium]